MIEIFFGGREKKTNIDDGHRQPILCNSVLSRWTYLTGFSFELTEN